MQQELLRSPTNGNRLPPDASDRRLSSTPNKTNGGDFVSLYSNFPPKDVTPPSPLTPIQRAGSVSLTPSSSNFDGGAVIDAMDTENCLYLAGLSLQYQEIEDRYLLCLAQLHEVALEADELRRENAQLWLSNAELNKRLSASSGRPGGQIAPPAAFVDEFRRLNVAETSPTSVLGSEGSRGFGKRVSLPKSISIRSNGYLRMNPPAKAAGSPANRNGGKMRVSSPVVVGSRRVLVGSETAAKKSGAGTTSGSGLELEVYNQGMFKTELCNKWQESGECPYGGNCQFAHGVGELRPVIRHPRYKTEVCRMVLAGDVCPYGHRCHFRHALSPNDLSLLPSYRHLPNPSPLVN